MWSKTEKGASIRDRKVGTGESVALVTVYCFASSSWRSFKSCAI